MRRSLRRFSRQPTSLYYVCMIFRAHAGGMLTFRRGSSGEIPCRSLQISRRHGQGLVSSNFFGMASLSSTQSELPWINIPPLEITTGRPLVAQFSRTCQTRQTPPLPAPLIPLHAKPGSRKRGKQASSLHTHFHPSPQPFPEYHLSLSHKIRKRAC